MKLNHIIKRIYVSLFILLTLTLAMSIPLSSGYEWGADIQLTTETHSDFAPATTQTSDGRIRVFWHSDRFSTMFESNLELFYRIYDGQIWSGDIRLTSRVGNDANPAVITTGQGVVWLVWASDITGNYELYYMTSTNNGASWSVATQLTNVPTAKEARPAIMEAADGRIWVAYQSDRNGNDDLFYRIYDGISWSGEIQITFDANQDRGPAIMQSADGKIWAFYGAIRAAHIDYEIYYMTSTNNGASWSTETRLTNHNAWDMLPTATQTTNGEIYVVWEADRSGQDDDLYYQIYDGSSWSADAKLTGDTTFDDVLPNIFQAENKTIWVSFASSRTDDMNIFFKTAKSLVDGAVVEVTLSSAYAYRGYGTKVYVTLRNYGINTLTFPVTAYFNGIAIGTQTVTNLAPDAVTTLTFTWTASGVALGSYTISASTGTISGEEDPNDNSLTDGTAEVRLAGDVNGDRTVNVLDAILISTYFGRPGDFPAGDISNDGAIDAMDAAILSLNYGTSE